MVMGSVPFAIFPHRDNLHLCEIPGRLSISGLRDVRAKCWEVEGRRTNNRDDLHLPDGHLCGWFVAMADDIETYLLVSGVVFFCYITVCVVGKGGTSGGTDSLRPTA